MLYRFWRNKYIYMIGIYQIRNLTNNKVYIGSSINIEKRWIRHKRELRTNNHLNLYLQRSWNEHKEKSFEFLILKECLKGEIKYWEEYYINLYKSYDRNNGYNMEKFSNGFKIISQETKQKLSQIHSGEKHYFYGKHLSEEHKQKISNSHKGKKLSEDHKRKIAENNGKGMKGKSVSQESKIKMSIAKKGKYNGEKSCNAKLTWKKVQEIREKYIPYKYTVKMLMKEYDVGRSTITDILLNKTWIEEKI